jgi:uncharacterized membrane protein
MHWEIGVGIAMGMGGGGGGKVNVHVFFTLNVVFLFRRNLSAGEQMKLTQ